MQRISILGNVGNDAEVKDFSNNQVIEFSVAVTEKFKNAQGEQQSKTTWFRCSKWGNNTALAQHIKKGDKIYVSGKTNNQAYLKQDGTAEVVNGINAFEIELLGGGNQQNNNPQPNQPNNTPDDAFPY